VVLLLCLNGSFWSIFFCFTVVRRIILSSNDALVVSSASSTSTSSSPLFSSMLATGPSSTSTSTTIPTFAKSSASATTTAMSSSSSGLSFASQPSFRFPNVDSASSTASGASASKPTGSFSFTTSYAPLFSTVTTTTASIVATGNTILSSFVPAFVATIASSATASGSCYFYWCNTFCQYRIIIPDTSLGLG